MVVCRLRVPELADTTHMTPDGDVKKERICSQMLEISAWKAFGHQSGIVLTIHHCNYEQVLLDCSSCI